MKFQVESSVFTDLRYSPPEMKLTIKFKTGNIYEYFDVSEDILQNLLKSESKGQYFNRNIRNNYKFIRRGK